MDKQLSELMQINIISENELLNNMIEDIIPNTMDSQIQTEEKSGQEFRIVVYKKENILMRFFKEIKFAFRKMKIFSKETEIELAKNNLQDNK